MARYISNYCLLLFIFQALQLKPQDFAAYTLIGYSRSTTRLLFVFLLIITSLCCCRHTHDRLQVYNLTCEHFNGLAAIDRPDPKLGWMIRSGNSGVIQSAYHIMVADSEGLLLKDLPNIWDSGKTISENSIQVAYRGLALDPSKKYCWKVKIWDQAGNESPWSRIASWQTGLFSPANWDNARWIGFEELHDTMRIVPGVHGSGGTLGAKGGQRPVIPLFRKSFNPGKKIAEATLFISGLGHYEAWMNGKRVGEDFLSPGWTHYDKTVFYNIYDVTDQINKGENIIGVVVGNGFHNINRERYRKLVVAYGMPRMICKLALKYKDGTTGTIISDHTWRTTPSPVTYSSIFGGEDYDACLEQEGWNSPGFDDSRWKQAMLVKAPAGKLTADRNYPVKIMECLGRREQRSNIVSPSPNREGTTISDETFTPLKIDKLRDSCYIYDFGQNISGIIELVIKGRKGQTVRLIPAELVCDDGSANQYATGAPYFYTYTLKGDGTETWRPRFTYYGFRYVQVEGAVSPSDTQTHDMPVVEQLKLLHTRNSAPGNGVFECSNELFNRIFKLIDRAIQSNLQSVVTDCPHREKLGWMEQTFLMGAGIHFNYDIYHLYRKLIFDMMDAQTDDGLVPDIAPEFVVFDGGFRDSPEWGSAAVILPWLLYRWYGDKDIIETAWPLMTRYVGYLGSRSNGHILSHGLGDWFDLGPGSPGFAQLTPEALTATAIYYYDIRLMSKMADILGKHEEQTRFASLATEVKKAFNDRFLDRDKGVYSTGSQTAMAMPLCLGLVEEPLREKVLNNLVDSIRANNNALTAGDVGFHYLVEALTDGGVSQLLFEMNNRDDVPGYGYQLKKGATALTESWQALESVSNNHLMLGHLMEWFFRGVGGIRQDSNSVAFRNLVICPEVVGDLIHATASFMSSYGEVRTEWEKTDGEFVLRVDVPCNSMAKVCLPFDGDVEVSDLLNRLNDPCGMEYVGKENGRPIYSIGSGKYRFVVRRLK